MGDRWTRVLVIALLVVLGLYFAQPYFDRFLYSASTPRSVEPRGNLAEIERTSIDLFERVSPSVVQVVGRAGAQEVLPAEGENGAAQSGNGFIWDGGGHNVNKDQLRAGKASL